MTFTDRTIHETQAADLDRELDEFQRAVERAQHNRWHGGNIAEREFESFLASLTAKPAGYGAQFRPGPAWENQRPNAWREVLDQVN